MGLPSKKLRIRHVVALRLRRDLLRKRNEMDARKTQAVVGALVDGDAMRGHSSEMNVDPVQSREEGADGQDGKIESTIETKDPDANGLDVPKMEDCDEEEGQRLESLMHDPDGSSSPMTQSKAVKKRQREEDEEPLPGFMKLPIKKRPINFHELLQYEKSPKRRLVE